ncbi:MAG TPA: long-chain fatty acid--CoA ligase [Polyangiaceae bacterium]|jgi:long-chain acyl-CoA synthetase|nr:long-chain fatty acid--CoA ligase [Polyangiaceae bacterium]
MNLASLAEQNLAEHGEYERLVFEGRGHTNRELHERSCRLATALHALGLSPGDKVVVMMTNCPEVFVSYAGIWRAGLVAIPVLFLLDANEVRYILKDSEAKAVFTSPETFEKVHAAARGLPVRIVVTGGDDALPSGALGFDALVAAHEPLEQVVPRQDHDIATILYTSGTTGRPKGVVQTHRNLYANAMNGWNSAKTHRAGETGLLVLPLAHTFGLSAVLNGYLFGTRAVLMRWFAAEEVLALIEKHRVKAMSGVPTMFVYMLAHPNASKYDTSSVERWLVGAAPMPMAQLEEFERKFGGTMYVGYGLTESCPGVAVEREGMPRKPGSTGVALEGVTIRVIDEQGDELSRGEIGEITVKGENVSPGYYKNREATTEAFRDGWLLTGDMGYLDEDGYLFVVERKKDLMIRGGFNVYPKDVEEVIYHHPAVREAAVVGVPDSLMGEEVCAYVVKKDGADVTEAAIIQHCQSKLAKYKTPRYVEFVSALPKTSIGKIQKKELRRAAAEKYAR